MRILGHLITVSPSPDKFLVHFSHSWLTSAGTWTKTSAFVGPRTPFARDLAVFDYSYDSGDDWEEEEEGAEEILSEIDSDGEGGSLDEDDDDGFLVPDDEVESVGHASGSGLSRSPSPSAFRNMNMSAAAMAKGKRKAEAEGTTAAKKRRQIVGPLIPFAKGPCLEDDIGRCEYEPFSVFRIQLLNGVLLSLFDLSVPT